MRVFCKAMHKEAELLPKPGDPLRVVCKACYKTRSNPQVVPAPKRDLDVVFDEKHDFEPARERNLQLEFYAECVNAAKLRTDLPDEMVGEAALLGTEMHQFIEDALREGQGFMHVIQGTLRSKDPTNLQNVPKGKMWADLSERVARQTGKQIWADTQSELKGQAIRCTRKETECGGLDWNSVMRGFRCIQPSKTRLPFWAPYQNWADLVCPHCSSSVSQGLTSGHHEMDGASPITLAMLRKEVPAEDLRFAEPRPTRSMVVGVDQEALGHVEALLGYFTTQDFVSGNPDKRRAFANALAWLNDNK